MKPTCPSSPRRPVSGAAAFDGAERRFPWTDYCFHSRIEDWRGFSSPHGGWERSKFRDLSKEFFGREARREQVKEMAMFGLIVAISAWPVIYMVVTVAKLLSKGHP